ncbi:hypothetical protein AB4Z54_14720 [Streptomyces sp. MCAF7]
MTPSSAGAQLVGLSRSKEVSPLVRDAVRTGRAGGLQAPGDAAAGLAGAAEDEDVVHAVQRTP